MKRVWASSGPQVIEQEAGIEECDLRDRPFIWSMTGGEIPATPAARSMPGRRWYQRGEKRDERTPKACPRSIAATNEDFLTRLTRFDTRQQAGTPRIKQLFYAREVK